MMQREGAPPTLYGRRSERQRLDELVRAAEAGRSGVLVVDGEQGVGKSALLAHLAHAARNGRVVRVSGAESEADLAFAGLHQLCSPLLDLVGRLPAPQADALGVALGLRTGSSADGFLVGLATLSLLSEASRDRPLVCVVDDAHWLDDASAQTLAFVARRLESDAVVLVVATRAADDDRRWGRLPRLTVPPLATVDAEALLRSTIAAPLDRRVRNRLVAETHGIPAALWDVTRRFSTTELAFGPQASVTAVTDGCPEATLARGLEGLDEPSRLLLLAAAAEPTGDAALLWRAAENLGLGSEAVAPAQAVGLLEIQETVRFRHPTARSVVYGAAAAADRRVVHQALADATDPVQDPDRRAWHLAHAVARPDERVARDLERSVGRAAAQGGPAAAAAFLQQAATLTPDVRPRVDRQIAAIDALLNAGAVDAARELCGVAEGEVLGDLHRARLDQLRARIESASCRGADVLPPLLSAARRLEAFDPQLAFDSYADALTAALFSARSTAGIGVRAVADAVRDARVPVDRRPGDLAVQAMAVLYADGYAEAVPLLRRAVEAFDTDELSPGEGARFSWLVELVAAGLWDEHAWDRLTGRDVRRAREAGAGDALTVALNTRVYVTLFGGDLGAARTLLEEIHAVDAAAGTALTPYGAIGLAAFRGDQAEAEPLLAAVREEAVARDDGLGTWVVQWAQALLYNGLGRYREALVAAREAVDRPDWMAVATWALVELVEAASRAGEPTTAADAFAQLAPLARASGSDWALGVAARCEAQLHDGDRADSLYRESIDRLGRTAVPPELARAHLLYGEWLRRAGRRVEAREQLRTAHQMLVALGLAAFAERARRELAATGETVRKRAHGTRDELTPQEMHVARLAAEGLTNPDIGTELFLSPRTVEWHMGKVFGKLGISSRRQLRDVIGAAQTSRPRRDALTA
ncbi:AAA family ATPase [Mumia sp. zg.B21]|uniref:helix-turn-helix transcriptional regulator n=1 Tax=Mumia sp. zg.B21 TaxID=2855447 RepID=UPI001C6E7C46|nr:LuxR family transcriptional regulator [Mumia sp. zg.B21]MBW9211030.1 AAA family ATPase [Mumia sp. zg.B21]